MHIYVCLETILKNDNIIPLIKEYYQSGNHITIACTKLFRSTNAREDIEKMIENSLTRAMFKSLWVFSITFAASATRILEVI